MLCWFLGDHFRVTDTERSILREMAGGKFFLISRSHFVGTLNLRRKDKTSKNITSSNGKSDKTIFSVVFARRVGVFSIARGYIGFMKGGWLVNLLSLDDHLYF